MTGTPRDLADRYLRLLGVDRGTPTLARLAALTAAHLHRVPFENVSKILHFRRHGRAAIPTLPQYLDGIERHHFGGTCYANASHFHGLLRELGYDVRLCGGDMSAPDVHAVNVVTLDGRDHLVDVGYGAPFWTPLPLDAAADVETAFGEDRYVLRPRDARGHSRLDFYRRGDLVHGYTVKPAPRTPDFFGPAILDSFRPDATFFNTTLVARFSPRESVMIRPGHVDLMRDGAFTRTPVTSRAMLYERIERHVGIDRALCAEALDTIPLERDRA